MSTQEAIMSERASTDDLTRALGKVIRDRRVELGLSQESLAELSSLHRTYISELEHGERNASIKTLDKLAAALLLSLVDVFSRVDDLKVPAVKALDSDACSSASNS